MSSQHVVVEKAHLVSAEISRCTPSNSPLQREPLSGRACIPHPIRYQLHSQRTARRDPPRVIPLRRVDSARRYLAMKMIDPFEQSRVELWMQKYEKQLSYGFFMHGHYGSLRMGGNLFCVSNRSCNRGKTGGGNTAIPSSPPGPIRSDARGYNVSGVATSVLGMRDAASE